MHYIKAMSNFKLSYSSLRAATILLFIFFASLAFGQSEENALKMVKTLRLGENLAGMTYMMSKTTTTFRGIEAALSRQKADELLKAEISAIVPKHQNQWNRNLAQAWSPLMTTDEFDSITTYKKESPFIGKFMSLQEKAGEKMRINSEDLLKTVMTEVLKSTFEKSIAK